MSVTDEYLAKQPPPRRESKWPAGTRHPAPGTREIHPTDYGMLTFTDDEFHAAIKAETGSPYP